MAASLGHSSIRAAIGAPKPANELSLDTHTWRTVADLPTFSTGCLSRRVVHRFSSARIRGEEKAHAVGVKTSRGGSGTQPSDYVQAQLDRLLVSPAAYPVPPGDAPRLQIVDDGPVESEEHQERGRFLGGGRSGPPIAHAADRIEQQDDRFEPAEPRRLMPERFRLERKHIPALVVIVFLALGLTLFSIMRAQSQSLPLAVTQAAPPAVASSPPATAPAASSSAARLEIHVAGAVKKPGVVRLEPDARVHDALDAAGGLRKGVKTGTLNLAQPLSDGQQVFVGTGDQDSVVRTGSQGSQSTGSGGGGEPQTAGSGGASLVNLNTASASELEQLPGVGPVMAGKIVDWRASHDRFSAVTELQEIDGVGPKTYARLAPLVTV